MKTGAFGTCHKLSYHQINRYLQSNHNEEFIHFWLDLKKYLKDYHGSSASVHQRFATELYEKYIESGAKYQLSEIKSKHRSTLKKQIQSGVATREMFDDIKDSVFDHLNRDSYIFFNSSEYFRFIVTYKHHGNDKDYEWVDRFEDRIESDNRERQRHILSSNQSILHSHGKNTMSVINKHNINSPVVRKGKSSPVLADRSRNGTVSVSVKSPSPAYLGGDSQSPSTSSTISSTLVNTPKQAKSVKKSRKRFGTSVFDNAPGI